MHKNIFYDMVDHGNKRRGDILLERGKTYDGEDKDMLKSFKKTAAIASILEIAGCTNFKGSDIANLLIILKQVRGAHAKTHGIGVSDMDRIDLHDDTHNYLDLLRANEIDEVGEA